MGTDATSEIRATYAVLPALASAFMAFLAMKSIEVSALLFALAVFMAVTLAIYAWAMASAAYLHQNGREARWSLESVLNQKQPPSTL